MTKYLTSGNQCGLHREQQFPSWVLAGPDTKSRSQVPCTTSCRSHISLPTQPVPLWSLWHIAVSFWVSYSGVYMLRARKPFVSVLCLDKYHAISCSMLRILERVDSPKRLRGCHLLDLSCPCFLSSVFRRRQKEVIPGNRSCSSQEGDVSTWYSCEVSGDTQRFPRLHSSVLCFLEIPW